MLAVVVLSGHRSQAVDPTLKLYCPIGHSRHSVCPISVPYVPASQGVQAARDPARVFGLKVPMGQAMQSEMEIDPAIGLYVPVGQYWHHEIELDPILGL